MAPLQALLEAAEGRGVELEACRVQQKGQLDDLEAEIAAKRSEKSIAAQNAVRELLKKREGLEKDSGNLKRACEVLTRAVEKLHRASRLGLSDPAALHEEKITLSGFAKSRLCDGDGATEAVEQLRRASGGAELEVKSGMLHYAGSKESLARLKAALSALESNFETAVACDDPTTLRLMDSRGEFTRISTKHGVEISKGDAGVRVTGPPAAAEKVASLLKFIFEGREDLDCPKSLVGSAKAKAKDVEAETASLVEVLRTGGCGGGGVICIRGDEECVDQAAELLRGWLDEKEGAASQFVDVSPPIASWSPQLIAQFRGDLRILVQNKRVAVKDGALEPAGRLELRGPSGPVGDAAKELQMILDFYKGECSKEASAAKAKTKPKAKPQPAEEDDWGAAPMAEPPPCSW